MAAKARRCWRSSPLIQNWSPRQTYPSRRQTVNQFAKFRSSRSSRRSPARKSPRGVLITTRSHRAVDKVGFVSGEDDVCGDRRMAPCGSGGNICQSRFGVMAPLRPPFYPPATIRPGAHHRWLAQHPCQISRLRSSLTCGTSLKVSLRWVSPLAIFARDATARPFEFSFAPRPGSPTAIDEPQPKPRAAFPIAGEPMRPPRADPAASWDLSQVPAARPDQRPSIRADDHGRVRPDERRSVRSSRHFCRWWPAGSLVADAGANPRR